MADAPDDFLGSSSTDGSSEFDLSKFYTSARDKRTGAGTTVRLTVPPSVTGRVGDYLARRVIPEYKTSADVYRDWLVVGGHTRAEQIDDPAFTAVVSVFQTEAELDRIIARIKSERSALDKMRYIHDIGKGFDIADALQAADRMTENMASSTVLAEMEALIRQMRGG